MKFIEFFTQKSKGNYFVIAGVVGIMLIIASDLDFGYQTKRLQNNISLQEYKYQLEEETEEFLREIDGVGNVKVMISLESGEETIYAQKEKTTADNTSASVSKETQTRKNSYENEYVIVGKSGQEEALVEKTMQPVIMGVAVVCSGADDIMVVSAVTNSLSVVLNIPTHKICVTKMR